VIEHNAIGGRGPLFVGTAADIADAMLDWVAEIGIDGFSPCLFV
jgi:alkanesulfonate monooxygenase SsuD/methylene tetrahydromethanopterin reductase-like flavin-dependent oxidoreductase (luciferase family)